MRQATQSAVIDLPLPIVADLIAAFEEVGIRYCIWKSNEHLHDALLGRTDIDLLVERKSGEALAKVLHQLTFVRVETGRLERLPDVEHYLGLDASSGTLVHLHVHYRLVLGERNVKNHVLDLEDWLFARCRMVESARIPHAEAELILLYVRTCLKQKPKRILSHHRRVKPLSDAVRREFGWLLSQSTPTALGQALVSSGLPISYGHLSEFLQKFEEQSLDLREVLIHKRRLLEGLAPYQRQARIPAALRKQTIRLRSLTRRVSSGPRGRKTLPGQGLCVAFVGADGAGKSALASDVRDCLSRKLRVTPVYLGIPKRKTTIRFLGYLRRSIRSLSHAHGSRTGSRLRSQLIMVADRAADASYWLAVAGLRWRAYRRALRVRRDGGIVVADRFPLREFWTMQTPMDGPRLSQSGGILSRLASRIERRVYLSFEVPDLVLVLRASRETLHHRKPAKDPNTHQRKVTAIEKLRLSEAQVILDAEKPYDSVLIEAKHAIWSKLCVSTSSS